MGVRNSPPGSTQSKGMSSGTRVILIKGTEYEALGIDSENRYSLGSSQVNFPPHQSLPKAKLNIS